MIKKRDTRICPDFVPFLLLLFPFRKRADRTTRSGIKMVPDQLMVRNNEGPVAEWLGSALQKLLQRFESARDLKIESSGRSSEPVAAFVFITAVRIPVRRSFSRRQAIGTPEKKQRSML